MLKLYPFLLKKSIEFGAEKCPHCNEVDIAFGLGVKNELQKKKEGGYCLFCQFPVKTHSSIKTFQYCLEVYRELFINLNDRANYIDKKNASIVFDDLLSDIISTNRVPSNERIIQFQALQNALVNDNNGQYPIGSLEKIAGYIIVQKDIVKPTFDQNRLNNRTDLYSLVAACLCVHWLRNFEVKNEFTLNSPKSTNIIESKDDPMITNNKGCFGILLFIIIGSLILFSI